MPGLSCGKLKNISLFQHILTSMEQTLPPTQTESRTLYQIIKLVENGANHSLLSCNMTYVGHFRSYANNFIVITKYKIPTVLIFLNVYTYVLYSLQSQGLLTNFCHLCDKWSIAALYSSLLKWCKEEAIAVLISSSDSNHLPQRRSITRANNQ